MLWHCLCQNCTVVVSVGKFHNHWNKHCHQHFRGCIWLRWRWILQFITDITGGQVRNGKVLVFNSEAEIHLYGIQSLFWIHGNDLCWHSLKQQILSNTSSNMDVVRFSLFFTQLMAISLDKQWSASAASSVECPLGCRNNASLPWGGRTPLPLEGILLGVSSLTSSVPSSNQSKN